MRQVIANLVEHYSTSAFFTELGQCSNFVLVNKLVVVIMKKNILRSRCFMTSIYCTLQSGVISCVHCGSLLLERKHGHRHGQENSNHFFFIYESLSLLFCSGGPPCNQPFGV